MTQDVSCERALRLAGQATLSGEMLAARWHVRHCPRCQQVLQDLWLQVVVLGDQRKIEQLLGIDLISATCRVRERMITWLESGTNNVLASLIRLSPPTFPPFPLVADTAVSRLGSDTSQERSDRPHILRQIESPSDDETIKWKMTFMVDANDPDRCIVEVQVDIFDRWDLAGIDVFLAWVQGQRRGQTNAQGQVLFSDIPIAAMGAIDIILRPPQTPSTTNGPQ